MFLLLFKKKMLSILNFSYSENTLWVHNSACKYRNKFSYIHIVCVQKRTQHTHMHFSESQLLVENGRCSLYGEWTEGVFH